MMFIAAMLALVAFLLGCLSLEAQLHFHPR